MIAHLFQDPQGAAPQTPPQHIENPALPAPIDDFGQLERLSSTFHHVDGLFYFTYAVCIVSFLLIAGVLGYSVVKYRRKTYDQPPASNVTHNTPLEVVWTVVPLIVVMIMFAWGWKGSLDMTVVPESARQYKAVASQWTWTFTHPNDSVPSYGEVWLPLNQPAAFTLESTDVLHAFFVPSMRVKRDVVPGRLQTVWFQPTRLGEYHLFCAEYCGQDHSKMYAKVHVVSDTEYAMRPWDKFKDSTPEEQLVSGRNLYRQLCANCHTVNGQRSTGPTWTDLYGKQPDGTVAGRPREVRVDGAVTTVTVDDEYVFESIRQPEAKKVVTFELQNMTAFSETQVDDRRVLAIIAYMKSLAGPQ